ncbi:hypothetical protein ABFG93_02850 [Pseudalkalibacillus hwajinpoensis]|uniref:hypothetical protein n=1 Tax=Guptibacillus hwajinpoensis TaxID=208199 RepID=UPI00325B7244
MGSILLLVTVVVGLLYMYWKGRNAEEETIDKNLIQGLIIADIVAVLVIHGVITAAEAEMLSDQSLADVENYLVNETNISAEEWGNWIHHGWAGLHAVEMPFDLDPG